MDIEFVSPDQVPQPKHKIRILGLQAIPYPDRRRVWVEVKVTPFQERPNLLLITKNSEGFIVSELSVIETMHANMEFTLHIRTPQDPAGDYEFMVELFYETRKPSQDTQHIVFTIPKEGELE
ncbi:MAG: hypothetical protein MUE54_06165 [Anaerolineae bacterium]|nr:hypothetical protein [Anaerolineae bacterium]